MHRLIAAAVVLGAAALAGCSGDVDGAAPVPSPLSPSKVQGQHGEYEWEIDLVEDGERLCLKVLVEPTILEVTDSPDDLDEYLAEQLWDPPACTPPLATSGPQFGLAFVPYVSLGDRYAQRVVIGMVVSEAEAVELVNESGGSTPVEVHDNGTFAAFPTEAVVAMSLQLEGRPYVCPVEDLGGGVGHAISHCERA